jgi:hypothetical protein
MSFRIERSATFVWVDSALQHENFNIGCFVYGLGFDIRHATNTAYLDFPIFVFNLTLTLILWSNFFNVITCPFSKTISCNKPDSYILFNNENISIFVEMTLIQGQGEEIGHNLLHIVC